jgi:two-component system, sensor histidine kinase and response regulator
MRIRRILMVEDDLGVAARYRLELNGFPVQMANTGAMALTLAIRSLWSLVLVDHEIAGLSGLDVLAAVRSDVRSGDVPVVMLSDRHDRDLLMRAFGLGAIDCLIKTPATPAQISHSVPSWITSHRARLANLPTRLEAHAVAAGANGNGE